MSSRVLVGHERSTAVKLQPAPEAAWRTLGWFGFALALIGVGQLALYFFPTLAFGSPEWEYGASAQLIGALPLPTIGFAALFGATLALGSRRGLLALSVLLVLLGLVVFAALGLFWTVAPMALRNTPSTAAGPIQQTVARTTLSGFGFGILYFWAAARAARQVRHSPRRVTSA